MIALMPSTAFRLQSLTLAFRVSVTNLSKALGILCASIQSEALLPGLYRIDFYDIRLDLKDDVRQKYRQRMRQYLTPFRHPAKELSRACKLVV